MERVIIKYFGDIKRLEALFPDTTVAVLFNQYAIVTTQQEYIEEIASFDEVEYLERARRVYFNLEDGRSASCITSVQNAQSSSLTAQENLTGEGVLVAIIDSGIDYTHPAFRREDGSSRIAYLWDQTGTLPEDEKAAQSVQSEQSVRSVQSEQSEQNVQSAQTAGRVPEQYGFGVEYTAQEIDRALQGDKKLVPVSDRGSGHGTAVAGVAAGNGRGSAGNRYRGIATNSELIVVKLGRQDADFSGTTEVMEGLDYAVAKAIALNRPIAVNLSFGTNNGPHDGQSLFENYIAQLCMVWKNAIVIASGNEGDARHHAYVQLAGQESGSRSAALPKSSQSVSFAVGAGEQSLTLQLWKSYVDTMALSLRTPSGREIAIAQEPNTARSYAAGDTTVYVYYGSPTPYTLAQEIYFEWFPNGDTTFVEQGIWELLIQPERIVDGRIYLWLPTVEAIGLATGFLEPEPNTTLTIPSTARNCISAGAYRSDTDSVAGFSGRGDTADGRQTPTLVAPGVGVMTTAVGGGYAARTGTSIAAPFVTGSAALLMEWGIVKGNDPYLYGQRLKAYLMKGARPLPGESVPSTRQGYGALCLRDSLS